jgi:GTP cyclohydrolase II
MVKKAEANPALLESERLESENLAPDSSEQASYGPVGFDPAGFDAARLEPADLGPAGLQQASTELAHFEHEKLVVEIASAAKLPTRFGDFRIFVFSNNHDGKEHLAMVHGDVVGHHDVVTRVHSECLTGDVLGSLRCDCREQLERSLAHTASLPRGLVLYMRQEGRGIGLTNKIRAYGLQEHGLDTVDANLALGFDDDLRRYDIAALMLERLGVKSIRLLTNNPDKVEKLGKAGVVVRERVPLAIEPNPHNHFYLATKARRSGHLLPLEIAESA